tara:strand:- start:185 stop:574 length:390 start_codon:yes stop_codon:yes gene_type:complete
MTVNIKDYYSNTGIKPKYNINGEELLYNDKMNLINWNGGISQQHNIHVYGVHYIPKTKNEIIKIAIQKKLSNKIDSFIKQHEYLYNELNKIRNWNQFADSLLINLNKYGSLTIKQIESAKKMINKLNNK